MAASSQKQVTFEVVWDNVTQPTREEVTRIWTQHMQFSASEIDARLSQLVVVMKDEQGRVVGVSTAYKTYIHQLRNYLLACRVLIVPEYRRENLAPSLLVATRDFLESIHQWDEQDPAIGLITLVENEYVRRTRTDAIWPASKMVYIGDSKQGHPIRVYYFNGARILP